MFEWDIALGDCKKAGDPCFGSKQVVIVLVDLAGTDIEADVKKAALLVIEGRESMPICELGRSRGEGFEPVTSRLSEFRSRHHRPDLLTEPVNPGMEFPEGLHRTEAGFAVASAIWESSRGISFPEMSSSRVAQSMGHVQQFRQALASRPATSARASVASTTDKAESRSPSTSSRPLHLCGSSPVPAPASRSASA